MAVLADGVERLATIKKGVVFVTILILWMSHLPCCLDRVGKSGVWSIQKQSGLAPVDCLAKSANASPIHW